MKESPVFLACVFAREDEGLIVPCIANLRRIGFQHVIVVCREDFVSEAPRLAATFADDPGVRIVELPQMGPDEAFLDLDGPCFGPSVRDIQPDWILALDGDEFPVVKGGNVANLAHLADCDAINIQRFNQARRDDDPPEEILAGLEDLETVPLITERIMARSDTMEDHSRWLLHRISPKVILRPSVFDGFGIGNHSGKSSKNNGEPPRKATAGDMVIVHLPFTSYARFERKIDNARAHIAGIEIPPEVTIAWHWRWWIRRAGEGLLRVEFDRETLGDAEFTEMRERGAIRTAREILDDG